MKKCVLLCVQPVSVTSKPQGGGDEGFKWVLFKFDGKVHEE